MELVQLPPWSTLDSISSSACSLCLHLTKEYRREISLTLCVAAGQEGQKWGARGPAAAMAGREHCWEMLSTLQNSPSAFSLSSGSHSHPELSPLQSSHFQGHSAALWGCFVPPHRARAMLVFLPQSAAPLCPPRCVQPSPVSWPGLASPQLQGHGEGRQALAEAQGGSHRQEGVRGAGSTGCPPAHRRHSWTRIPLLRAQHGGGGGGRGCSKGEGREALEQGHPAEVAQGRAGWMKSLSGTGALPRWVMGR